MNDMQSKNPVGRPTKYAPEWMLQKILDLGQEGKSIVTMCCHLGISQETFSQWRKEKPEFSETVKEALTLSQNWWEERGQRGLDEGKDFNATTYIFNMKNRFGWKDRVDVTSDDKKLTVFMPVFGDIGSTKQDDQ